MPAVSERDVLLRGGVLRDCVVKLYGDFQEGVPLEQAIADAQGEKLVLYSCRHGYAHRAHVIWDLPPKVAAAAMGHSVQTHLAACIQPLVRG